MKQYAKGQVIDGYREVITRGTYPGETGTGYGFGPVPRGLISAETRGYYDGYREPCRLEILCPLEDWEHEGIGYLSRPGVKEALRVEEAIAEGLIRVVPEDF